VKRLLVAAEQKLQKNLDDAIRVRNLQSVFEKKEEEK